jgi:hypothetical protein
MGCHTLKDSIIQLLLVCLFVESIVKNAKLARLRVLLAAQKMAIFFQKIFFFSCREVGFGQSAESGCSGSGDYLIDIYTLNNVPSRSY